MAQWWNGIHTALKMLRPLGLRVRIPSELPKKKCFMTCGKARAELRVEDYIDLCTQMGETPRITGLYLYDHDHEDSLRARLLGKEHLWERYKLYKIDCELLGTITHPRNSKFTSNINRDDFGLDEDRYKLVSKLASERRDLISRQSLEIEDFDKDC